MQQSGLRDDQVSQVRGFADQRLRNPKDALDPSNRRVSIIVQYINNNPDELVAAETSKESDREKPSAATGKMESSAAAKKAEDGK
jgi:chemotaxis protein MotB